MAARAPAHWPESVNYITSFAFDRRAPRDALAIVPGAPGRVSRRPGGPALKAASDLVKIKLITDKGHPACGQRGLVAARAIPKRTHIIDYIGLVTTDAFCSPTSEYTLRLAPDVSGGACTRF